MGSSGAVISVVDPGGGVCGIKFGVFPSELRYDEDWYGGCGSVAV